MDKFIIFSSPRSGSTTLSRIFEANGVRVCFEPFHPIFRKDNLKKLKTSGVESVVGDIMGEYDCIKQLTGHGGVDDYLLKNYRTVGLKRKNILQAAVSYAISDKIGVWQKEKLIGNEFNDLGHIDIRFIEWAINRIRIIEKYELPYCVYYEDLFSDDGISILDDIFSYCGYKINNLSRVNELLSRDCKMNSEETYRRIKNIDEIRGMGCDLLGYLD
jgi:LPS sulfotransferase NodH